MNRYELVNEIRRYVRYSKMQTPIAFDTGDLNMCKFRRYNPELYHEFDILPKRVRGRIKRAFVKHYKIC